MEGLLYYTILYEGLEHVWILVSMGVGSWNQRFADTKGQSLYTTMTNTVNIKEV